jgi:subtilisin family serine protease
MQIVNPTLTVDWVRNHLSGRGVTVAIIDSGVAGQHPDLSGRLKRVCLVERGAEGTTVCREVPAEQSVDSYGHGTAVAGAIVGLAPGVDLCSVKVLNAYNQCTGQELIAGLRWSLAQGFKLINMSLATAKREFVPELYELCERACHQDAIIVAAKRNFGDIGWPAAFSSIIGVDREDFVERFLVRYYPRSVIGFGAAGTNLKLPTSPSGYGLFTGTSFATPHITGIVALLLEAFPELLPCEAKAILKSMSLLP